MGQVRRLGCSGRPGPGGAVAVEEEVRTDTPVTAIGVDEAVLGELLEATRDRRLGHATLFGELGLRLNAHEAMVPAVLHGAHLVEQLVGRDAEVRVGERLVCVVPHGGEASCSEEQRTAGWD
jgi:hypothetical protein